MRAEAVSRQCRRTGWAEQRSLLALGIAVSRPQTGVDDHGSLTKSIIKIDQPLRVGRTTEGCPSGTPDADSDVAAEHTRGPSTCCLRRSTRRSQHPARGWSLSGIARHLWTGVPASACRPNPTKQTKATSIATPNTKGGYRDRPAIGGAAAGETAAVGWSTGVRVRVLSSSRRPQGDSPSSCISAWWPMMSWSSAHTWSTPTCPLGVGMTTTMRPLVLLLPQVLRPWHRSSSLISLQPPNR
jgi:hypothetical protein